MGFQLTLGLKLNAKKTLKNFLGVENQPLIQYLLDKIDRRESAFTYISGRHSFGKSHVLQASCHRLVYQGLQAGYLDLEHVDDLNILNGLDQLRLICFDNWSSKKITPDNQIKILQFISQSLKQKHLVILGSAEPYQDDNFNGIQTPDVFVLNELKIDEIHDALEMKLEERGLCLPESIQKVIIDRAGLSVKSIEDILDILESSQDSEKKKISTAHLKRLLALS